MEAFAIMRTDIKPHILVAAWPTKPQAEASASVCSHPFEIVPVWIEGVPVTAHKN